MSQARLIWSWTRDWLHDSILSPSTISSKKLESTVNSNALQQASTSASSLSITNEPLANSEAITSPKSFRINVLSPDAFMSWNIATSKLSLKHRWGGGLHVELLALDVGMNIWVCIYLYSSKKLLALCPSRDGSCIVPPCVIVFRWDQSNQACTKNSSNSSNSNLFNGSSTNCRKSFWPLAHFCKPLEHPTHTSYATLLPIIRAKTDS